MGCATNEPAPDLALCRPSPLLVAPTPAPVFRGRTVGDLYRHVTEDWRAALASCNADKAAIAESTKLR